MTSVVPSVGAEEVATSTAGPWAITQATQNIVTDTLSLQNGLTAGYGVNDGNISNPKPAAGTYGGNPAWAPYRVGLMRNTPGSVANGKVYTLYFMFNPNQIEVSFALNTSGTLPPLYAYGPTDQTSIFSNEQANSNSAVPNMANSQTVSWSLFFDRTYDMLYGNTDGAQPWDDRGVLKDVAALYNLMGTFSSVAPIPVSTPVQVVFGANAAGQIWGFTGYLSMVSITYGIFRHDMIPSRCEVDLALTATYVAPAVPSTAANGLQTNTLQVNSNGQYVNVAGQPIPPQALVVSNG